MASISRFTKICLVKLILLYRFAISMWLGHCCRFEPTCSVYAIDAITKHGCVKGCVLALRRIMCCHPWHSGGSDPVPTQFTLLKPFRRSLVPRQIIFSECGEGRRNQDIGKRRGQDACLETSGKTYLTGYWRHFVMHSLNGDS